MKNIWEKLKQVLSGIAPFKGLALLMLVVNVLASISEVLGLSMVVPFLGVIIGQGSVGGYEEVLLRFLDYIPGANPLIKVCVMAFVVIVLKHCFVFWNVYLTHNLCCRMNEHFNNVLMEKYMLSTYSFWVSQKQGEAINNIMEQAGGAANTLLKLSTFVSQLIFAFALYSSLLLINWKLTFILTGMVLAAYFLFGKGVRRFSSRLGREKIDLNHKIFSEATENLSGFQLLKAYGLEKIRLAGFKTENKALRKLRVKFQVLNALPNHLQEIAGILALFGILYGMTSFDMDKVRQVLPELAALILIAQRFFGRLGQLVNAGMRLQFLFPTFSLVHSLANKEIKQERTGSGERFERLESDISFEHVSYSYDTGKPVFNDLCLTMGKNKMTAVIGASGIGKSTIANMLIGFLEPGGGRIMINGRPLAEYELSSWRSKLGYVGQDTIVFNTSIRENIRLGRTGASDEQVEEAAKRAALHDFIMDRPKGYETRVGDRGAKLSGGQRQRIAIARAILRDPDLYIFDEATSALDTHTERQIQKSIEELGQGKTVLVITHRLTTIENADATYDLGGMNGVCGARIEKNEPVRA